MKVKDLIKHLSELDQESIICTEYYDEIYYYEMSYYNEVCGGCETRRGHSGYMPIAIPNIELVLARPNTNKSMCGELKKYYEEVFNIPENFNEAHAKDNSVFKLYVIRKD
jgi:hypothetical protein